MTFRTELLVAPAATPLPPGARLLTIGSCFAGVLGQKLRGARLPVLENPFGTVLNPVSACRLVAVACGADDYDLSERAVERDGRWFSYDAPSAVNGPTPDALRQAMDQKLAEVREFIGTADALVLTLGTAWTWRLDGEVVANCHKQPQGIFQKSLLSVPQIVAAFAEMHSWLLRVNPNLRVILTVSPVRHPKETLEGSSVSKATLRLASHHLATLVRGAAYFPAYELLLDDLRDYRFFAADMLHPSPLAEEYIFGKFTAAWFDDTFTGARTAWAEIDRALAHRSANPTGEAHQQFLLALLDRLDALAGQGYAVGPEVAVLTAQLTRPRAAPPRNPRPLPAVGPVGAATPVAAPVTTAVAAALPAPAAVPAIRPIKPIIRVVLPPPASVGAPASTSAPTPTSAPAPTPRPNSIPAEDTASEVPNRPDATEANGEERQSRSRRGRRRGGRDERPGRAAGPDAPLASTAPVTNLLNPSAADSLPVEPTADQEDDATNPLATTDSTSAKKRRGRRGGRRHKQRRDAENPSLDAFDEFDEAPADDAELAAELGAGAEAAAEVAVQFLVPETGTHAPEPVTTLAEEVALETAFLTQTADVPDADAPASATTERKPTRPTVRPKTPGAGKKITLQKVKSTAPAAPTPSSSSTTADSPPLAASADAMARAAQPFKTRRSGRPERPERPDSAKQTTPSAAPSAAPTPSAAAVTPAVTPAAAVPTASAPPSPPADKPLPTMARTPGRAHAKRAVGTPVEQATAARVAKKAGVGALLAALGGSAPAAPVPAAAKPTVIPDAAPTPEKTVAPERAKAAAPEPKKAVAKAPAKAPEKTPAKTPAKTTKAAISTKTAAPAKAATSTKIAVPAKAAAPAKAPAKAPTKTPKAPPGAKTATPAPANTAAPGPPEPAPPANAKRPAKPRPPKTK